MMERPHDFKRGLKAIWAQAAQGITPSLEALYAFANHSPYRNGNPLAEVLAHLALQQAGQLAPPLIPRITPGPVAELCQLVLLWAIAGENEAAASLAHSIPVDFPWMWCRENEYREEEAIASIALLSRALGKDIDEMPTGDPYFQTLALNLSQFRLPLHANRVLDWIRLDTEEIQCALTFYGERTSLGVLVSDHAEIRAFGPQVLPLSNPMGFGIRPIAQHGNRWASPASMPEVWFETKSHCEGRRFLLDLSFFGLKPNAPLAFSFYVKAKSAQVENEKIRSKTLQRYHGPSKPVLFGGGLTIECLTPGKMEVIPLAGVGGFWSCEYLASFEIHPVNAKMSFSIH